MRSDTPLIGRRALVNRPRFLGPRSAPEPTSVSDGAHFWAEIFGNDAPVAIEIGSGDGTFLVAAAAAAPHTNFLGVERSAAKERRLDARVAHLDLPNVRTLRADAACVLALVPSASVAAYHVYFPDPWPKSRHARRRLFTPALVDALARTLAPGGRLLVATDVYGYLCVIRTRILADPRFDERESSDDHPGFRTAFARKYRAAGHAVYPATFVRRASGPSP